MNTASLKLVLNGAKQSKGLLDKWKKEREMKNFDAIDTLRRSMLTDEERDAVLANSPAHIRAVAEHMRKEDGAAKALEKARTLAMAYDDTKDNGLASSKASAPVDYSYVDVAAAKAAAAQQKEDRVAKKRQKNADLSKSFQSFRKNVAAASKQAQGQAAGLAAGATALVADKTGVDKKDVQKRAKKLRKQALKNTKPQRKALNKSIAKNKKAAAKQTDALKKQASAQLAAGQAALAPRIAASQELTAQRIEASREALAPRIEAGREVAAARGAAFAAAANQALDVAKERGASLEKDVVARAGDVEQKLQKRAAQAEKNLKKRGKAARKQAKKDAKRNKKAYLKNKKKFQKDVAKRKAVAGKKADKILASKGLKKQKKSNKFGLIVLLFALAAGAAAVFKFLTAKKPAPANTPKVQDFAPSTTGAAAKAKAADAAKAETVESAAAKATEDKPEKVADPAVETAKPAAPPAAKPAAAPSAPKAAPNTKPKAESADKGPKPSQMPGAPGVPSAPGAPTAPAVHHAQGKDAETKDSEAATEHDVDGDFPLSEGPGDGPDEGGRHRL